MNRNISSTEFQNRAGRYIDEAAKAPVFITRYERPVRVLIDIEEYERLKALDTRRSYHPADLPDDLLDAVMNAKAPEWTAKYNHELDE